MLMCDGKINCQHGADEKDCDMSKNLMSIYQLCFKIKLLQLPSYDTLCKMIAKNISKNMSCNFSLAKMPNLTVEVGTRYNENLNKNEKEGIKEFCNSFTNCFTRKRKEYNIKTPNSLAKDTYSYMKRMIEIIKQDCNSLFFPDPRHTCNRQISHVIELHRYLHKHNLLNNTRACIFTLDSCGHLEHYINGKHLAACEYFVCDPMHYKCPKSYCIPRHYLCDGTLHCPGGGDENVTTCSRSTCPGQFLCNNSAICLLLASVCNGIAECPLGDDEHLCFQEIPACPNECQWF